VYIDELIWLPQIVEKLAVKHNVSQAEVEDVIANRPRVRWQESGHRSGEDMYAAYGRTGAGRYLVVFFVRKSLHSALVISARDMDATERNRYERK
jgi:uncharacterized DUF497 family protein